MAQHIICQWENTLQTLLSVWKKIGLEATEMATNAFHVCVCVQADETLA